MVLFELSYGSTAHRGYVTHPTLGVLGLSSHALLRASCSLLSFHQVLLRLLELCDETIRVAPEDSSTTSRMLKGWGEVGSS